MVPEFKWIGAGLVECFRDVLVHPLQLALSKLQGGVGHRSEQNDGERQLLRPPGMLKHQGQLQGPPSSVTGYQYIACRVLQPSILPKTMLHQASMMPIIHEITPRA